MSYLLCLGQMPITSNHTGGCMSSYARPAPLAPPTPEFYTGEVRNIVNVMFYCTYIGYGSTVMLSKKLHVAAKAHDCKKHFWVATVMYASWVIFVLQGIGSVLTIVTLPRMRQAGNINITLAENVKLMDPLLKASFLYPAIVVFLCQATSGVFLYKVAREFNRRKFFVFIHALLALAALGWSLVTIISPDMFVPVKRSGSMTSAVSVVLDSVLIVHIADAVFDLGLSYYLKPTVKTDTCVPPLTTELALTARWRSRAQAINGVISKGVACLGVVRFGWTLLPFFPGVKTDGIFYSAWKLLSYQLVGQLYPSFLLYIFTKAVSDGWLDMQPDDVEAVAVIESKSEKAGTS